MNISLDKIRKDVNNASPYQRDTVMAAYSNQKVEWKLEFNDIYAKNNNLLHVTARNPGGYPWVYFDVNVDSYPQFKLMKCGEKFNVIAMIDKITSAHTIDLKDVKITNPTDDKFIKTPNMELSPIEEKLNKQIHIEKLEIINGDKVNRDKIEQHGEKNKISIKNKGDEGFLSKFFWQLITGVIALIVVYVAFRLGWNN